MNKQELIEHLNQAEEASQSALNALRISKNTSGDYERGLRNAYGDVSRLVAQLAEQPKVKVPQFLDKYIQENKGECASDIFSEEWLHDSADELDDEVDKWLYDNDGKENDRRYLIAVQAFVTGEYEVEKEPLYQVKIPTLKWNEYSSELETEFAYLARDITSDEYTLSASDKDSERWRVSLTEETIKNIDERFWAFAVPVEEDK